MTRFQIIISGRTSRDVSEVELETFIRNVLNADHEVEIDRATVAWCERDWGREAIERAKQKPKP